MNETLKKIGAENFELKEQIRMRDAQIKERDESIQLLNARMKYFAAAANFTQRANCSKQSLEVSRHAWTRILLPRRHLTPA